MLCRDIHYQIFFDLKACCMRSSPDVSPINSAWSPDPCLMYQQRKVVPDIFTKMSGLVNPKMAVTSMHALLNPHHNSPRISP